MSHETHKADQIAFHFYTKLFSVLNHARATATPRSQQRVDKWFNLETPDSDLFTKEHRDPYKSISLTPPPPFELQVLLSIPSPLHKLNHTQALVHISPDSTRTRIEPTPRFVLLESWVLSFAPNPVPVDVALPTIYKHGIPLFRSLFSLLRVLPTWTLYKRLKRRTGGTHTNGQLGIQLRVADSPSPPDDILYFHTPPSPTAHAPLPTATHAFPGVPHPHGTLSLSATYLSTPNFQLDSLESLLSSRFLSLDLDLGGEEGFVPTLSKRGDAFSAVSLPSVARSPPKSIERAESDSTRVAERFVLPSRTNSTAPHHHHHHHHQQQQQQQQQLTFPTLTRLRKESLPSPSSSLTAPLNPNPSTSSLSSSPGSGVPIRRPSVNPVHPFKTNTLSSTSASTSSPSLRNVPVPVSVSSNASASANANVNVNANAVPPLSHTKHVSLTSGSAPRVGAGGAGGATALPFAPSSLGDRRDRKSSLGLGVEEGERARKRYSSSFGHRYAGSVGSAGSAGGSNSGVGVGVGGNMGGGGGGNIGGGSFLNRTTDDDDISVFVQDIDAAKPLEAGGSPMLTSEGEVDVRLKKMNEVFVKSLEGMRRRDRDRDSSGGASEEEVVGRLSVVSALVVLVWEYVLTIQDEYSHVWKKRRNVSLARVLYCFLRYFAIGVQLTHLGVVWSITTTTTTKDRAVCERWFVFLMVSSCLVLGAVDVVLMLRVYALYNHNTKIACILAGMVVLETGLLAACAGRTIREVMFDPMCNVIGTPVEVLYFTAAVFITQTVLLMLTFARRNSMTGVVVGRVPVVELVVKDGVKIFIVVIAVFSVTVPYSLITRISQPHIVFVWPLSILSIAGCRMIMNMLRLDVRSPDVPSGHGNNPTTSDGITLSSFFDFDIYDEDAVTISAVVEE